ncbi:MAG: AAA family ATPase [Desulfobulbaceae bacterium]|jgi:CO dehydrogenase maturation factor|nr:AAA family ATPase [Desulfobulbaceae bacterium]
MKIAISGKGGVGKTTIMALAAREFQRLGRDVLIIDADPSPHMAQTLGISPEGITPLAEMTGLLAERAGKTPGSPYYQLNPQVNDLLERFMIRRGGYRLMVLGAIQKAEAGCACPENQVLRKMLQKMLLGDNDVVLLDMEAGVEHLGRGTVAGVDHLLIVVIPSRSSIRTGLKIRKLAEEARINHVAFVGNLIGGEEDRQFLRENLGIDPLVCFPESPLIRRAERTEQPLVAIEDALNDAPAELVRKLIATPQP